MDSKIRFYVLSPTNTGKYHGTLKEETSQSKYVLHHNRNLTERNTTASICISMSVDR